MSVKRNRLIAGEPVLWIRELLRQYGDCLMLHHIRQFLFISRDKAQAVAAQLEGEGYITRLGGPVDSPTWKTSDKGLDLIASTTPKPFGRKMAEVALANLMGMLQTVNQFPTYLYRVPQITLFGDYLTPTRKLRSLDIGVYVEPKFFDQAQFIAQRRMAIDMFRKTKDGAGLSEEALSTWPERELWDTLQGDDPRISLYRMNFPFDVPCSR